MKKRCVTSVFIASVGLFGATPLAGDSPQTTATLDNAGIGLLTETRNVAPVPPAPTGKNVCVYDNYSPLDDFGSPASQKDTVYPFWAEAADDFILTGGGPNACDLSELWFSTTAFGTPGGLPVDPNECWTGVKVTIYEDAEKFCGPGFLKGPAGEPIDLAGGDRQHAEYCPGGVRCELKVPMSRVTAFPQETSCLPDGFNFDVHIDGLNDRAGLPLCTFEKDHKYWMAISPVQQFSGPLGCGGQTAIHLSSNSFGHPAQQIFLLLALPWTPLANGNADACPPDTPPAGTARDLAIMIVAKQQCPTDLTGDGEVNAADLAQLLGKWGACPCPGCCPSDFDGNGVINAADLATLLGSWGPC